MEYLIAALLVCSEPRLSFHDFYEKVYFGRFPGVAGEQMHIVNERAAEAVGLYGVYSVRYTTQCEASKAPAGYRICPLDGVRSALCETSK